MLCIMYFQYLKINRKKSKSSDILKAKQTYRYMCMDRLPETGLLTRRRPSVAPGWETVKFM